MFTQCQAGLRSSTLSLSSLQKNIIRKNALYLSIGRKNTSSGKENKQVSPSSSEEGSSLQFIFGSHYSGESTPAASNNMTSTGHVACKFPIRSHNVYSDRSIHNAGVAKPLDETVRTLFGHKDLRTISVEGLMSGTCSGMSKASSSSSEQSYDSLHMNSPFRTYSPV